jgi:bifunctional DNA-binding transcriptional regulator/antitoxin component of YhaV-PrlF toxin-antitoxin module
MSKVTSKLQVTLPKAIADRYGVAPGADLVFEPAGDSIRVLVAREPGLAASYGLSLEDKQALLDAVSRRQASRNRRYRLGLGAVKRRKAGRSTDADASEERGWTREALYDRGRAR